MSLAGWQIIALAVVWIPVAILAIGSLFKSIGSLPGSFKRFFAGGALSLIAFFPGIGGGIAIAGMWVGLLRLSPALADQSLYQTVVSNLSDLLFLVVIAPAIAMAATVYIVVKFFPEDEDSSQGEIDEERVRNA